VFLEKILRVGEGRIIRRLKGIADAVNSAEHEFVDLTDAELRALTDEFKERYADGETLDELLVEAFAAVREAASRVLGQRHYDVQLMGAAALHFGNIAEMKTGEGKTLTCVPAAYLNALSGDGVHVVTVNDYLAKRDAETMGRVHRFMGLETGVILANERPEHRRKQYGCDITYGTNNEFGFDFLRDKMAWSESEMVQRGHAFAIVDEVDSILIDEARTPLIISGPVEQSGKWYTEFARIVPKLKREDDYEVDEAKRMIGITESGVTKVERQLGIDNLYEAANTPLISFMNNALKAKELFKRDKDYIVTDGEVLIVDEFTGRVLAGRRFNDGMHQAIEAKEGVRIKEESQTLATITLQNYYRLYKKLAGMTGTAMTEAAEFQKTYDIGVVPIPTNMPMIRLDQADVIYKTEPAKFSAVVEDIVERHAIGQPVLVGTTSVQKSELLSGMLTRRGVRHEVLNAKNHSKEAEIIAQAGRPGAVTVATNMAGRGTDIMLGGNPEHTAAAELRQRGTGPETGSNSYQAEWDAALERAKKLRKAGEGDVLDAGGLYVLGTERHDSRRIDNQLRGRAGRQGDPGESRFYLSLQDELMRRFNSGAVEAVMNGLRMADDVPIESKMVSRQIQGAQTQLEQLNAETRKNVLKYDEIDNKQRMVIYDERDKVLKGADLSEQVRNMIDDVVAELVASATADGDVEDWDLDQLWTQLKLLYPISIIVDEVTADAGGKDSLDAEFLRGQIHDDIHAAYDEREKELSPEALRELERMVVLKVLDQRWRAHLYEMDYLRDGISLRGYGQRDPLVEYQREAFELFSALLEGVKEEAIRYLFNLEVQIEEIPAGELRSVDVDDPTRVLDVREIAAVAAKHREIRAKGLDTPRKQVPLQYSAPTLDGDALGAGFGSGGAEGSTGPVPGSKQPVASRRVSSDPARNAPCSCGSGKKYKKCHGAPGA
jgi:preprotein translocase subunit SecA